MFGCFLICISNSKEGSWRLRLISFRGTFLDRFVLEGGYFLIDL